MATTLGAHLQYRGRKGIKFMRAFSRRVGTPWLNMELNIHDIIDQYEVLREAADQLTRIIFADNN